MAGDDVGQCVAQAVGLGHVHGEPAMLLAVLAGQGIRSGLQGIRGTRQQGHAGAEFGQLDGAGAADALRGAAYQGMTSAQIQLHGGLPLGKCDQRALYCTASAPNQHSQAAHRL